MGSEQLASQEAMRDYGRVEQAIRFLEEHQPDQPALADVAEHVGLSPWHFQRLFQRWAGVSPKRFLQFLTVEHAKQLLDASETVLETTWATGLSSPGRLHDLFVTVEAMSPGEYKSGGQGLEVRWGVHPTPFGDAMIAATDRGVCQLYFGDPDEALGELERRFPDAEVVRAQDATRELTERVFHRIRGGQSASSVLSVSSNGHQGGLALHLRGTNFQLRVWRALLSVPEGEAVTYGGIAKALGQPGASRAVGRAVGANPISVLIPCHRVLRQSGDFGGYRWGTERKKAILGWEAASAEAGLGN